MICEKVGSTRRRRSRVGSHALGRPEAAELPELVGIACALIADGLTLLEGGRPEDGYLDTWEEAVQLHAGVDVLCLPTLAHCNQILNGGKVFKIVFAQECELILFLRASLNNTGARKMRDRTGDRMHVFECAEILRF